MTETDMYCEICGEQPAEIRANECGFCVDCFGEATREAMAESGLLTRICGRPIFQNGQLTAICCNEYGKEHDHHAPI